MDLGDIPTRDKIVRHLREEAGMERKQIAALLQLSLAQIAHSLHRTKDDAPLTDDDIALAILDLAEQAQHVKALLDPVITHRIIRIESDRPIAILLAGCFHLGGRWTYHSPMKDAIRQILDHPQVYAGLLGDEVDNFMSGSFAGARSVYDQAITPDIQRQLWKFFLGQVSDSVLWGTWSQHGSQWDARYGFSPIKESYLEHGIPFFDGAGYVSLHVGKQKYNLAVSHKFPGHSMHNKNHAQMRALKERYPNADMIVQADKHSFSTQEQMMYGNEVTAGNRKSPFVHLLQVGTLKTGPDPYTIAGWERGAWCWPFAVFYPDRHLVKVWRHWDDVLYWLDDQPLDFMLDQPPNEQAP